MQTASLIFFDTTELAGENEHYRSNAAFRFSDFNIPQTGFEL
jgi:hypothetical protein